MNGALKVLRCSIVLAVSFAVSSISADVISETESSDRHEQIETIARNYGEATKVRVKDGYGQGRAQPTIQYAPQYRLRDKFRQMVGAR